MQDLADARKSCQPASQAAAFGRRKTSTLAAIPARGAALAGYAAPRRKNPLQVKNCAFFCGISHFGILRCSDLQGNDLTGLLMVREGLMMAPALPDHPQIDVLPRLGEGGPVVYGAVAAGEGVREFLAARLLESLALRAPAWTGALDWGALTLMAGPLGRPLLKLGGEARAGPVFQRSRGHPLGRHGRGGRLAWTRRWQEILRRRTRTPGPSAGRSGIGPGVTARAAPRPPQLLWAAKEAAVKALGSGFHTVDPLDLEVVPLAPAWEGQLLLVRAAGPVSAWARALPAGWLALAVA